MATHNLVGRIFLTGNIKALTGLRIGGSSGSLTIGGVDLPVIREALTNRPYIPGSSLKGKMRSLLEKWTNAPQNQKVGNAKIHVAGNLSEYKKYPVNPIFGVPGDKTWVSAPNRLIVRDVPLDEKSALQLLNARTDMPYTEIKWEVVIDRITSQANPRQIERVPAGAVFGPLEIVFNVYLKEDIDELFWHLLTAMELLEDDYLGGHGSRGSGKIKFHNLSIAVRAGEDYISYKAPRFNDALREEADEAMEDTLAALVKRKDKGLNEWLLHTLFPDEDNEAGKTDSAD